MQPNIHPMKNHLTTLLLPLFISTSLFAGSDTGTLPAPDQAYPLDMLPQLETLYFNQEIEFTLTRPDVQIDHVEFNRGITELTGKGFKLSVEYANVEEATGVLKVYTRDAAGNIALSFSKKLILTQKLKNDVSYHDDLFMLDDKVIDLNSNLSKYELAQAKQLKLNATRFQAHNIKLSSFDMVINTANGKQKLHSADGIITNEMKEALRKLNDGDTLMITNVLADYEHTGQKIKMNINYTPAVTIGTAG